MRTLPRLPFLGRVPNSEALVLSHVGEREPLLPARLLLRLGHDGRLLGPSWWKSLEEKKQLSSVTLAALHGLGELRSPNTLSSIMLWQLLSLEKRWRLRPVGDTRDTRESIEGCRELSLRLPGGGDKGQRPLRTSSGVNVSAMGNSGSQGPVCRPGARPLDHPSQISDFR